MCTDQSSSLLRAFLDDQQLDRSRAWAHCSEAGAVEASLPVRGDQTAFVASQMKGKTSNQESLSHC